jgi:pimeloyl-ACP methyl ester carboxylesterase
VAHSLLKRFFGQVPMAKVLYYKMFYPSSDLLKYPRLESNFRKIVTQDLTPDTLKVDTPTLILWGATDTYVQPQDARLLHNNIRGSKLKMFEGKGHGLPLFHPQLVATEIEKFLSTR